MENQDPIISFLMQEKIVDETSLQAALEQQQQTGQSLLSILKKEELLDEEQFTRVVAAASKIEFVNLSPEMIEPMVAHLVPYEVANRHNVIAIKKENNQLVVAMSSPLDLSVRDQLRQVRQHPI